MIGKVWQPRRLEELWPLLEDGATVMAGGTDFLVRRAHGSGSPGTPWNVACLSGIAGLGGIDEQDGCLRLGAGATHAALLAHPLVRRRLPVLAQALAGLGSPQIRNMGTLGGNIATASPAGDTLPPLYALEATVELASKAGRRELPLARCITGPGETALAPGEIITAVSVHPPRAGAVQHFEKVGRRNALAIAVVSLAAILDLDDQGTVTRAALALGSVGPTVCCCAKARAALIGRRLDRETLAAAGALVRQEIAPIDDIRATAGYRRQVAGNLLLRLAAGNQVPAASRR
ncbi:FAD binding domain-containing protein [Solidesulfovibrio sp.]